MVHRVYNRHRRRRMGQGHARCRHNSAVRRPTTTVAIMSRMLVDRLANPSRSTTITATLSTPALVAATTTAWTAARAATRMPWPNLKVQWAYGSILLKTGTSQVCFNLNENALMIECNWDFCFCTARSATHAMSTAAHCECSQMGRRTSVAQHMRSMMANQQRCVCVLVCVCENGNAAIKW